MKKVKKISKNTTSSSSLGMSTKERMIQRKKQLEEKGKGGGGILFPKEGTMRVRLMNQGPDKELGLEIIQFYLGSKLGGVISPATFDEPCPIMERYKELKNSKDEIDQELAGRLAPRRRYIIAGTVYVDEKGKEVDTNNICTPILVPRSVYQDIIDLYLDEDDWGDMTDEEEGYDIKITRSGSGKLDTTYSVTACPGKKPLNPKYRGEVNLEEVIRNKMKSYDEIEEILNEFLNESPDEEEDTPKEKKKKIEGKKKKKFSGDI